MSKKHVFTRAGFVAATVGITGLLGAGVASAHVTANIYGDQPEKGGYGAIVLRVPNEDAAAGTVKLEVDLKPEYAISSGRVKPVPGWTAEVTKTKLPAPVKGPNGTDVTDAVTKITWTAQPGTRIAAGSTEFQEFEISVGPLPSNVDELDMPAIQTYDNGKVVNWDQPTPPSGEEPEHPAPTVQLAAKSAEGHGHSGMDAAANTQGSGAQAAPATDTTARWLGGAGLVVGALGVGFGAGATLRARRATTAAAKNGSDSTE